MRKKNATQKNITSGVVVSSPWRLVNVKPLKDFQLSVIFMDGTQGIVEMSALINSPEAGVFSSLRNRDIFNQVNLVLGVVTWPGEIDLAPDAMYKEIKQTGKWVLK